MKGKENFLKAFVLCSLLVAAAIALTASPVSGQMKIKKGVIDQGEQQLYPTNDYGWLTYYMHEVYERYVMGQKAYEKREMDMAKSNLIVMKLFIDKSKENLPDTLQDGKEFDQKAYVKTMDKLADHADQVLKNLDDGKWASTPEGEMDPMMKTCVGCHAAYNIPTDFRIDTKFKVLTHSMHEIYELYRQAGPLLQQEKWDTAKHCFVVLMPYVESIPENIPEANQDGEPMNEDLFIKTYKELKQFTEDMIEKLETKKWMTGKPLPPPRIVVDNCYACHAKVVKIPSPW